MQHPYVSGLGGQSLELVPRQAGDWDYRPWAVWSVEVTTARREDQHSALYVVRGGYSDVMVLLDGPDQVSLCLLISALWGPTRLSESQLKSYCNLCDPMDSVHSEPVPSARFATRGCSPSLRTESTADSPCDSSVWRIKRIRHPVCARCMAQERAARGTKRNGRRRAGARGWWGWVSRA